MIRTGSSNEPPASAVVKCCVWGISRLQISAPHSVLD